MNIVKSSVKLIERQYGLMGIPQILSPRFLSLITGTKQIVHITTKMESGFRRARSFRVSFDMPAAATNEKRDVTIPAWYCFPKSLEKLIGKSLTKKEATCVSLVLINGSSCHEALHVRYTEVLFQEHEIKKIEDHALPYFFKQIVNIVEDIRIETFLASDSEMKFLNEFVNLKNEIFFQEEKMKEIIENGDKNPAERISEALVFFKCVNRRESFLSFLSSVGFTEVGHNLLEAASRTANTISISERIFNLLVPELRDAIESKSFNPGNMDFEVKISSESKARIEITKEQKEELEAALNDGSKGIPPVKEVDILDTGFDWMYGSIPSNLDFGFVRKLKLDRQIVPHYGEPRKNGARIIGPRISRIVTDGKMFGRRGESFFSEQSKQPSFVILGDFSGSMRGKLLSMVISTLEAICAEMIDAGIPHSIYGHTSASAGGKEERPIVYHVTSNKMRGITSSKNSIRFRKSRGVDCRQNYDGYAIQYVSKKFDKGTQNKVLIVLSDGQPMGPYYSDPVGHTMEAISDARKRGIKVISLSLVQEVMEDNDRIYGKRFNVEATSQSKLESGLQKIIMGK